MSNVAYQGIELEGTDKDVRFSHSRFTETSVGRDWMDALLSIDKNSLSHAQFNDISKLSSVANLNYQVCNGGIGQYFDNGYDSYRDPYSEQDVAQFGKSEQVAELRLLARFGENVFPDKSTENSDIRHIADNLDSLDATNASDVSWAVELGEDDDSDYYDEPCEFEEFNDCFYNSCRHLESLMELYAQYLCKTIAPERFDGQPAKVPHIDLASESRDMKTGKDALVPDVQDTSRDTQNIDK